MSSNFGLAKNYVCLPFIFNCAQRFLLTCSHFDRLIGLWSLSSGRESWRTESSLHFKGEICEEQEKEGERERDSKGTKPPQLSHTCTHACTYAERHGITYHRVSGKEASNLEALVSMPAMSDLDRLCPRKTPVLSASGETSSPATKRHLVSRVPQPNSGMPIPRVQGPRC